MGQQRLVRQPQLRAVDDQQPGLRINKRVDQCPARRALGELRERRRTRYRGAAAGHGHQGPQQPRQLVAHRVGLVAKYFLGAAADRPFEPAQIIVGGKGQRSCLLYTSPSPRDS